ncbi:hypothetical protein J4211_01905 [Candidatus Woesearchaeota archaeon]|nr:hypothetical protein [Candidatus Woesearchaeota archaeon]
MPEWAVYKALPELMSKGRVLRQEMDFKSILSLHNGFKKGFLLIYYRLKILAGFDYLFPALLFLNNF